MKGVKLERILFIHRVDSTQSHGYIISTMWFPMARQNFSSSPRTWNNGMVEYWKAGFLKAFLAILGR